MIKFYCQTVLVWMMILYCLCCVFENAIKENGYVDNTENRSTIEKFTEFLKVSAIPLVRLFFAFTICLMVMYPKDVLLEKLEELKKHE